MATILSKNTAAARKATKEQDVEGLIKARLSWHHFGTPYNKDLSIGENISNAGLGYDMVKCETQIILPDKSAVTDPERVAWVRSSDNKPLIRSTPGWEPLQNNVAITSMFDWSRAAGTELESIGRLRDGKVVFALAKIKKDFSVGNSDRSLSYLLLKSSNIVGVANSIEQINVRVVCWNGMMASKAVDSYRQNHMSPFDLDKAAMVVEQATDNIGKFAARAATMAKLNIGLNDAVDKVLAPVFTPKAEIPTGQNWEDPDVRADLPKVLREILHSYETGPGFNTENGWGVMNGVTHWSTHVAGRTNEARAFRSWIGDLRKKTADVETRLLQLAE